jgi:hypothetical protein
MLISFRLKELQAVQIKTADVDLIESEMGIFSVCSLRDPFLYLLLMIYVLMRKKYPAIKRKKFCARTKAVLLRHFEPS